MQGIFGKHEQKSLQSCFISRRLFLSPSRNATIKINEGIAFRRLTDECISSFIFLPVIFLCWNDYLLSDFFNCFLTNIITAVDYECEKKNTHVPTSPAQKRAPSSFAALFFNPHFCRGPLSPLPRFLAELLQSTPKI
jgi:hypothetical protein